MPMFYMEYLTVWLGIYKYFILIKWNRMNRETQILSSKLIIHIKYLVPIILLGAQLFPILEHCHPLPNLLPSSGMMTVSKWVWDRQLSVLKFPSQILCSHHLALSFHSNFLLICQNLALFSLPYSLWNLPLVHLSSWLAGRLFGQCGNICSLFCCLKDCIHCVL